MGRAAADAAPLKGQEPPKQASAEAHGAERRGGWRRARGAGKPLRERSPGRASGRLEMAVHGEGSGVPGVGHVGSEGRRSN